jgi:hypothetical protein
MLEDQTSRGVGNSYPMTGGLRLPKKISGADGCVKTQTELKESVQLTVVERHTLGKRCHSTGGEDPVKEGKLPCQAQSLIISREERGLESGHACSGMTPQTKSVRTKINLSRTSSKDE